MGKDELKIGSLFIIGFKRLCFLKTGIVGQQRMNIVKVRQVIRRDMKAPVRLQRPVKRVHKRRIEQPVIHVFGWKTLLLAVMAPLLAMLGALLLTRNPMAAHRG